MLRNVILAISLLLFSAISLAASLNINKATAEEFAQTMVGVGSSKAEAIVKDRKQNGKFLTLDDMVRVKGIGVATIEKNRDNLTVK